MKVVLVTGTSSGIGRAAAEHLAARGFAVFGGSLEPVRLAGVETIPLDVRSDASVRACVGEVLRRAGRIDALVNNAGYALGGAIEEATLDQAKAQFETNFFGMARMVAAALPIFRKERAGRIVNVCSGAGITAEPFAGFYSASKFAIEGYTEALRHEVRPFAIHVSLIEPGFFRTQILRNAPFAEPIEDYAPWRARVVAAVTSYCEHGGDPALVAKRIGHVLESKHPRLRYRVGLDVAMSAWLRRLLPESLFQRLVRRYYHLA